MLWDGPRKQRRRERAEGGRHVGEERSADESPRERHCGARSVGGGGRGRSGRDDGASDQVTSSRADEGGGEGGGRGLWEEARFIV